MPDHIHVVTIASSLIEVGRRTAALMSAVRRGADGNRVRWDPVPPPRAIPDAHHLRRQLRYLALNPCRAGLASDPLAWFWSTHRDVVGAVVDPWVSSQHLAAVLGEPVERFAERWHKYVSADPSVHVNGTRPPVGAIASAIGIHPLARVLDAAAAAHRVSLETLTRRGAPRTTFLALAQATGWDGGRKLGALVSASARTVSRRGRAAVPAPAWLCLGDDRLLPPPESAREMARRLVAMSTASRAPALRLAYVAGDDPAAVGDV